MTKSKKSESFRRLEGEKNLWVVYCSVFFILMLVFLGMLASQNNILEKPVFEVWENICINETLSYDGYYCDDGYNFLSISNEYDSITLGNKTCIKEYYNTTTCRDVVVNDLDENCHGEFARKPECAIADKYYRDYYLDMDFLNTYCFYRESIEKYVCGKYDVKVYDLKDVYDKLGWRV